MVERFVRVLLRIDNPHEEVGQFHQPVDLVAMRRNGRIEVRQIQQHQSVEPFIGLGDLVTGSIKRVFDQVGVKPGEIPVVGWGNSLDTTAEVLEGYVNAAQWQDPQATSFMALSLALMATEGVPPAFNIITGALYEKDTAQTYADVMSGK